MEDRNLTKSQKFIFSLLALFAIVLIGFKFFNHNKQDNKLNIVTSSSNFYTVSSCVNRYLNYIYQQDNNSILDVLSDNYISKNNINKNNVIDKIGKLDKKYGFEARKMYEQEVNDNVKKYYVKGFLVEESLSDNYQIEKVNYYLIVYLDSKNSTYSIEPYDGKVFLKEEQNEKK